MTTLSFHIPFTSPDQEFRRNARQLAMQFLYQLAVQKGGNLAHLDDFLAENSDHEPTRQLARKFTLGAWQDLTRLDELIVAVSENRQLSRIDLVDLSNLRLGVHQLLSCADIPVKVVINEAVELAKTFSTAQAPGYVNGLLDAIYKKITAEKNPAEPATPDEKG